MFLVSPTAALLQPARWWANSLHVMAAVGVVVVVFLLQLERQQDGKMLSCIKSHQL